MLRIGENTMVKVEKIFVQGDDGKTYTVDKNWIRQFVGICNLEHRVHTLEKPMRMQQILDVLKAEGAPRSSSWMERHIPDLEWRDVRDLERDGKIYYFKSGTHTMWQIATIG